MQEVIVPPLSKAEENCLTIAGLVKRLHYDFLELGGLLLENQASAFWSASGSESFKDFVQQLGVNYSWATGLMRVSKLVAEQILTKEEIMEIGVAKTVLLLPHTKDGKLSEDIKLLARDSTYNDLRVALGHNLVEQRENCLVCPRCASEFDGFACPKCGDQIQFQWGMVRAK